MSRRRGSAPTVLKRVMTAVTAAHSQPQAAAEVRICSLSPAPARWAMTTEKPLVIPVAKPMTRKLMAPVAPTPASSFTPTRRPTITASAMLYICWNRLPIKRGIENRKMAFQGTWTVMVSIPRISFFSTSAPISASISCTARDSWS